MVVILLQNKIENGNGMCQRGSNPTKEQINNTRSSIGLQHRETISKCVLAQRKWISYLIPKHINEPKLRKTYKTDKGQRPLTGDRHKNAVRLNIS